MTPAQRIRKAALGMVAPNFPHQLMPGDESAFDAIYEFLSGHAAAYFDSTDTERRMFLLMVAEILENE